MLFEALKILLSTGWTQLAALSAALTGAVPVPFVVPVPLALWGCKQFEFAMAAAV